jgi:hypothetical protein
MQRKDVSIWYRRRYCVAICRYWRGTLPSLFPNFPGQKVASTNIAAVNVVKSDSGTVIALVGV